MALLLAGHGCRPVSRRALPLSPGVLSLRLRSWWTPWPRRGHPARGLPARGVARRVPSASSCVSQKMVSSSTSSVCRACPRRIVK
eukprot:509684-Lingulodinium_polyedra.AAC.1